jgi:ABC-type antimicrobial peptide transport system permease subunit
VFVRGRETGENALQAVRTTLRGIDPGVSLDRPASMTDVVYESITQPRHLTTLLLGFALAALALASVGIFGLLSYTVAARRREIGLRMALGANPADVVRMIVRLGVGYAAAGAVIGLAVAVATTRWVAGALFTVSPTDPATLVAVTGLLIAVATMACWIPARRAARVDPIVALRSDA